MLTLIEDFAFSRQLSAFSKHQSALIFFYIECNVNEFCSRHNKIAISNILVLSYKYNDVINHTFPPDG